MLDEKKLQAISLLLAGRNKTDIAKIVGVSRPTLYSWLSDSEIKEEMKSQREELVEASSEKLVSRLDTYLEKLHELATTSQDKRTAATCAMYLVDRILGKVPSKIEQIGESTEKTTDDDILTAIDAAREEENIENTETIRRVK